MAQRLVSALPRSKASGKGDREGENPSPFNHTTNLQNSEGKKLSPSQSLVLTEITKIRTRDWEKKLKPRTVSLWNKHSPLQGPAVMSDPVTPPTTTQRKWHLITWIVHHGCPVNTSSSRYKKIIGWKQERREKTRVVICVLKTPGRHNEVGGERMLLQARTSPSLSSHPSAKPSCTTTTGIFHLWLSG